MTRQDAIDKALKLLSLAKSDNPHEAALAARRAAEIMARFDLTDEALDTEGRPDDELQVVEENNIDDRDDPWRLELISGLGRIHGTYAFVRAQSQGWAWDECGLILFGRRSRIETTRYLYQWLQLEIQRLAKKNCKGQRQSYVQSYCIGAAETILLEVAKAQDSVKATSHGSALVTVDKAIALLKDRHHEATIYAKTKYRVDAVSTDARSTDGRAAGQRDAQGVYSKGGRPSIGAGSKRIGG